MRSLLRRRRSPGLGPVLWALGAAAVALQVAHQAWGLGAAPGTGVLGTPLFVALIAAAALSCIVRSATTPGERAVWGVLGAGLLSYGVGSLWYFSAQAAELGPFPTGPDILWLSFFACAVVALTLLVRASQRAPLAIWLDGAMGGLTVTAIGAAVIFEPVLEEARHSSAVVVGQLSYPLIELVLLGFLVVLLAVGGWRLTAAQAVLGLAFLVLAVTDSVFLAQIAQDDYKPGTVLDAGWPTALALVGAAAWVPSRHRRVAGPTGWRLVVVPGVSALVAIALQALSLVADVGALAASLASVVLVLAVVRLVVTLLALQRAEHVAAAAEAHRQAVVGHARMVLFAFDRDGTFSLSEGKGLAELGLEPGQVVGQSVFDVYREAPDVIADIRAVLADERETRSSHVTVGDVRFETHYTPVRDAEGEVCEVIGVATDVTERYRAEQELQRSYALLRHADKERRELLASLVRAQEDERRRIAADIHDDSVQVMTAVGLRLEMLRRRADPTQHEAHERLEEAVRLSIARLRRLIFELRPPALDRQGLAKAIELYLHDSVADGGCPFNVHDRLREEPPDRVRTVLYRIALEALANVRKHARATIVIVELDDDDGGVLLTVSDDGVGLAEPDQGRSPAGHLGMTVMRERAEMAGGWWCVEPCAPSGTRVRAWVPWPPQPIDGQRPHQEITP